MEDDHLLTCPHCNKDFEYWQAGGTGNELYCPFCENYVLDELED